MTTAANAEIARLRKAMEREHIERLKARGRFQKSRDALVPLKEGLASCSVFRQTASMEAETDCKLQSNSI